jgi:hypothetical protein
VSEYGLLTRQCEDSTWPNLLSTNYTQVSLCVHVVDRVVEWQLLHLLQEEGIVQRHCLTLQARHVQHIEVPVHTHSLSHSLTHSLK